MENKIKTRIEKLFESTLKTISKQSNCEHNWKDKNGASYYRCKKCGFLAEDKQLDKLIFTSKLLKNGWLLEDIKKYKKYI